jgi:hypothetical protein
MDAKESRKASTMTTTVAVSESPTSILIAVINCDSLIIFSYLHHWWKASISLLGAKKKRKNEGTVKEAQQSRGQQPVV